MARPKRRGAASGCATRRPLRGKAKIAVQPETPGPRRKWAGRRLTAWSSAKSIARWTDLYSRPSTCTRHFESGSVRIGLR